MSALIALLVLLIVGAVILWLYLTYIMPTLPKPFGVIILVVIVLIFILILLSRTGILNL